MTVHIDITSDDERTERITVIEGPDWAAWAVEPVLGLARVPASGRITSDPMWSRTELAAAVLADVAGGVPCPT